MIQHTYLQSLHQALLSTGATSTPHNYAPTLLIHCECRTKADYTQPLPGQDRVESIPDDSGAIVGGQGLPNEDMPG